MINILLVPTIQEEIDATKDTPPSVSLAARYDVSPCGSLYLCRELALKEIPQWAESRTLDALLYKYRCLQWNREFQDEEVRRIVCGLSQIVRFWSFGKCAWATDAAALLDQSEPLEYLSASSLEVRKMRIFQMAYSKQYAEARRELEQAYGVFGEDAILVRMRVWLRELEIEHRRVLSKR